MLPSVAWNGASAQPIRAREHEYQAHLDATPQAGDSAINECLAHALDAAREAGATYADAQYHLVDQEGWAWDSIKVSPPTVTRDVGFGVRALYNGYWGYAALLLEALTSDTAARMGRGAVAQAKMAAKGRSRVVDLAPRPVIANGTWVTPIEIDPFVVSWDEKTDVSNGLLRYLTPLPFGAGGRTQLNFVKLTEMFASTDGSAYSQTLYRTGAQLSLGVRPHWRTRRGGMRTSDSFVSMAGAGWEYVRNAPFEQEAPRMIAQAMDARLAVPADVGRYDVVFDGAALAKLADRQLGAATELDRAMGFLANRDGTSYLNDPLSMLGTQKIGSPLLNVTANRSMSGGAATVKWDSEGVEPDQAALVTDGILTDFQTTRESAIWLEDYYNKTGKPLRSHGGAMRAKPWNDPQQGAHNLVMAPSAEDISFEALCSGIKKGIAVLSGRSRTDQQQLNGESYGEIVYEITNGKLGRTIDGAVLFTRAPDLWKNLIGLGGKQTVCALGLDTSRRDAMPTYHTVSAPAAAFRQLAVTASVNGVRSL